MKIRSPAKYPTVESFRARWREIDAALDCDAEVLGDGGPLGWPIERPGRKSIANRFCIHPMEGWDGGFDGSASELTLRRWRNFGRSGAGLVWGGEAFAVQQDGRANARQLCFAPGNETPKTLARLLEATREGCRARGGDPDALVVGLQLTHSGRFSRPNGPDLEPRIAFHNARLADRFGIAHDHPLLSDDELRRIRDRFVVVASLAADAGFDFVDVKCAHGYLLHELLAARSRPGAYGGPFEHRTRLLREIVEGIRAARPTLEVGIRVSIADAPPHGHDPRSPYADGFGIDAAHPSRFDLDEPMRLLELIQSLGIQLVNLTLGSPYYCPHLQRPAAYPPCDGYPPPRDPLEEVAEHIRVARQSKARFPKLVFVGTGYTYLQEWLAHVAQFEIRAGHVDLVGLGRMVLSYPEFPADVLAGRKLAHRRICRTLSDCTNAPRNGLVSGCYPLDAHYKSMPEATRLARIKKELRD